MKRVRCHGIDLEGQNGDRQWMYSMWIIFSGVRQVLSAEIIRPEDKKNMRIKEDEGMSCLWAHGLSPYQKKARE
jgi:hypothetical protein